MSDTLKNLGLEESEAKVYQALLQLGPSTVSEITKKAVITRTLGYHVLQKLSWSGLVERASGEGSKIKYSAKHPRSVLQFVLNHQHQWERRYEEAEKVLPELVSLYKLADKPVVRYEEGTDGVKSICNESLNSSTEILSILDIEMWDTSEFRNYAKNWDKERSARCIKERELLLDTPRAKEWMRHFTGSFKNTQYRLIKKEQLPGILDFGGTIDVFDNKAIIMLLKKPNQMGILIESTALSNILKGLFELAWQVGVPVKTKRKK